MTIDKKVELFLLNTFSLDEIRSFAYHKQSFDYVSFDKTVNVEDLKQRVFKDKPVFVFDVKIKAEKGVEIAEIELRTLENIEHKYIEFMNKSVLEEKSKLNIQTYIFPLVIFFLTISIPLLISSFGLKGHLVYSIILALAPLVFYFSFKRIIKNLYLKAYSVFKKEYINKSLDEYIVRLLIKKAI